MLHLHPTSVRLGDQLLDGVTLVAIDRTATRLAEEWTDFGPFAAMADVPEQRVAIRIVRRISRDEPPLPPLGEQVELRFSSAPTSTDAGRTTIRALVVITGIAHQLPGEQPAAKAADSATQTISLLAISEDGAADPITITPALGTDP